MSRPVAQPFPDFQVLGRIGAGAMGAVFLARQLSLDRLVALKVLKPSLSQDARFVARLQREARLVARLDHPNIVHAYDLREEKGYHFFVMEYVEGRSLRELLRDWGRLPEEQVLRLGLQVAGALEHARVHGVIHRDVKPANLLVQADGSVKVADLGLAKGPEAVAASGHDQGTLGTPLYMSPEQAIDSARADIRSDVYSLGATLFHAACGAPPFTGTTLGEVLTRVLHEPPPLPSAIFPGVSRGLELILRKCLVKDPARRYQTPGELRQDLLRVQAAGMPAVDEAELQPGRPRRRLAAAAGALLAVALLGAGAWALFGRQGESSSPLISGPAALDLEALRRQVEEAPTSRLAGLLEEFQALQAEGREGAAALLGRVRSRLHQAVQEFIQPRLESWRRRLEAGEGLDTFPRDLDRALAEEFPAAFGVVPASFPDPNQRSWIESRRLDLLGGWEERVAAVRLAVLAALEEAAAAVEHSWAALPAREVRRRQDLLSEILGRVDLPRLPERVLADLAEARDRIQVDLEARLRREARELVISLTAETVDKVEALEEQARRMATAPEALREVLAQARELQAWLARDAPPTAAIPARLLPPELAWSRESLVDRAAGLTEQVSRLLARAEEAQMAEVAMAFGGAMRRHDYAQAESVLAAAGVATAGARARLQELEEQLALVRAVPEQILAHLRLKLLGRPVYLVVDKVGRTVRVHRCPPRPAEGNLHLETEEGSPLQLPFSRIGVLSLLDLMPAEWRAGNARALGWFLYWHDLVVEARVHAARLPEPEGLLARIDERARELALPQQEREQEARRLLKELKDRNRLALSREALALAEELITRFSGTATVQQNREEILAERAQAAGDSRVRAERNRVEGLFPGWVVEFRPGPEIRATVDLGAHTAGPPPPDGWVRRPGTGLCRTAAGESQAAAVARAWRLPTQLDGEAALAVQVALELPGEGPPPWILLTCHGVHAGLAQAAMGRRLPRLWTPLVGAGEDFLGRFRDECWRSWLENLSTGRGWSLLAPARYTLTLELAAEVNQERKVLLKLDGVPLGEAVSLRVPRGVKPLVEIRLGGPAAVAQVSLSGRPGRRSGGGGG